LVVSYAASAVVLLAALRLPAKTTPRCAHIELPFQSLYFFFFFCSVVGFFDRGRIYFQIYLSFLFFFCFSLLLCPTDLFSVESCPVSFD
jgi:hypothetical protein